MGKWPEILAISAHTDTDCQNAQNRAFSMLNHVDDCPKLPKFAPKLPHRFYCDIMTLLFFLCKL